ncbi:MAG: hypothetical protein KGV59_07410 [Tenacibaculum sp.]|nr:hypothetical protein [Tenacibaculum sp.]
MKNKKTLLLIIISALLLTSCIDYFIDRLIDDTDNSITCVTYLKEKKQNSITVLDCKECNLIRKSLSSDYTVICE